MPFRTFHLDADIPRGVALDRLRATLSESEGRADADFTGSVDMDYFRLTPVTARMNSFMPRIRGRVDSIPNGARISGTMFLHPFVLCFILFWVGFLGWQIWQDKGARTLPVIGLLVFLPVVSVGTFYFEAAKAERRIANAMVDRVSESA